MVHERVSLVGSVIWKGSMEDSLVGLESLVVTVAAGSSEQVAAVEVAAPVVRVGLLEVVHPIHPLDHHSHHPEECYTTLLVNWRYSNRCISRSTHIWTFRE